MRGMNTSFVLSPWRLSSLLVGAVLAGCATGGAPPPQALAFPITATTESAETYFGTSLRDPYRWLEDTQSPPAQQVAPRRQRLLQHFPPGHWLSVTQEVQELSMQEPPTPHSTEPQQSPVTQAAVPPSSRGQHLPMPH